MDTTTHLQAFLNGLIQRDAASLTEHIADNVKIKSPIVEAAFDGKTRAAAVFSVILSVVDRVELVELITNTPRAVAFLSLEVSAAQLDGVLDIHLDESGLIERLTIFWRPLPAMVLAQQKIAPLIGMPAMQLVAMDAAASAH